MWLLLPRCRGKRRCDKAKQSDGDIEDPLNAYRYSAKRFDTGSQTIDMGARRFGPDFNRFLQVDQYMGALADLSLSTDPLTANRYSLAGGNPITFVETDGHMVVANGGGTAKKSGGSGGYVDGWATGGGRGGSSSGGGSSSTGGGGPSPRDIAEDLVGVVKGAFEETGRAFGHLAYDAYACVQDRSACWDEVQRTTAYVSEHFFESVLAMGGAVKEEFERKKARGDTGEAVGGIVGIPGAVLAKLRYLSKLDALRHVDEVTMSGATAANFQRFVKRVPKSATEIYVHDLPGGGSAFQAVVPAREVPGSFAIYEKQVSSAGETLEYTKTTYGVGGEIIHVKDKLRGFTMWGPNGS